VTCISLLSYQNNCFQQFVEKSDKAITSTVRTSSFIMNQGITDERRLGLVGEYIFNTIIWAGHLSQYHKRTEQSIGHFKLTAYTLTHTHTHAYTRVVQRNKNSMKTPTSSLKCTKFDWRIEWHKVYLGTVHFVTRVNLIFVYHQAATV